MDRYQDRADRAAEVETSFLGGQSSNYSALHRAHEACPPVRELRGYQADALDKLRKLLAAGRRRVMLQLPTGGGKTRVAGAIAEGVLSKGNRLIFCVPAISLIDQTVRSFWDDGIRDVGVIQADHPMTDARQPIQVASVQTLQRRRIPEAHIVIVDEAHKQFASVAKWMRDPAWEQVPFIGLSATPWSRGLGKLYDDLVIAATIDDLINEGYLSPFRVFAPSHPDLSGVRVVAGDYHEGDLGEVMNKAPLIADVVETWRRLGEGRPTLVFAVDRAHARHLQRQFQTAGVATEYIDAHTDLQEREAIRKRFQAGEVKVVCNVGCLTTGVDWDVRCIVLARPTRSEILFVQMVGRGLRPARDKADCLVLDHSDTHLRLGFVTDIRCEALDDGSPAAKSKATSERKEPLPKDCPSCGFVKPPKAHKCPACGFAPEKRADVEVEDGELVEFGAAKRKREMSRDEKAGLYGQLRWIARERGYSEGWASHKFRERAGVWPNLYHDAPLQEPTPETLAWVKSRQIAFAKGKGKRHDRAAA